MEVAVRGESGMTVTWARQEEPMAKKNLKALSVKKVITFKIRNRKGYAAIYDRNLTEGRTIAQALARMAKAVKRMGYLLG
jgi:hypothetical protein